MNNVSIAWCKGVVKGFAMTGLTLVTTFIGVSSIAANCQPPPKSEVVAIEGVVCTIFEAIPQTSGVATYLCSLVGPDGKPMTAVRVTVPLSQVTAFEQVNTIRRLPPTADAGK